MIGKWLKGYFFRLYEGRAFIEDIFRRRSSSKGIPNITDGEFYSCLDYEDADLREIKDAYRERDFSLAAQEFGKYCRDKFSMCPIVREGPRLRKRLREMPQVLRHTVEKAERICAHNIVMPTGHSASFETFIDWLSDFNGKSWMFLHCSDFLKKIQDKAFMKQYDLTVLPVSMELNKHQHLGDLGRAYFLTGDERYAQEFVVEIEDWIERNPVNWGIGWLDAMTVAQRVISWLSALACFAQSDYMKGEDFVMVLKNLLLHCAYLIESLQDRSARASRHIAAACALYLFSVTFPEFESTKRWKSRAQKVLESEASSQFCLDGVYRERSLGMQVLLTEFLLLTLIWDRYGTETSSPAVLSAAERSLEFLMFTLSPGGKPQVFGDTPITRAWRFSTHTPHEDFKNLMALGAYLFNRGDFKFAAEPLSEDLLWFFGTESEKAFRNLSAAAPSAVSKAFIEGGFFNFRDSWNKDATSCLFYGNPKRRFAPPEKGIDILVPHKDLMSFSLTIRGEPFIIETGSCKGKKKFQSYFPKTAAHNTILVDGKEQASIRSVKGNKKYMHMLKNKWFFSDEFDYLLSGNAGFEDLRSVVVHRRELLYLKEKRWFLIKDTLDGTDEFNIINVFHFAPELDIILRGDYGCLIRGRREFMRLNPYFPGDFSCSPSRGKQEPVSGWYAKDINRVEPCQRLEYFARLKLPAEIYTWVSWARGEFRIPPREELEDCFRKAAAARGMREEEVSYEVGEK